MPLAAEYEIVSVDRFGNAPYTHRDAYGIEPIREELNRPGQFAFELPINAPGVQTYLKPITREVQVYRNSTLVWWGVITRREVTDLNKWKITCRGLLWYFSKLYIGRAGRQNFLANPSFDNGTLSSWTAAGVTAGAVTQWGGKPGVTYQANLYQGGSGQDTFLRQTVTVSGGQIYTLSGYFQIRSDATWVGPALDGRGLYIERRHPTTGVVEDVQFFAITDDTPRGVFQRATVTMFTPPGRDSVLDVRLYATRCTNPTPSGGRPPGSIIWDEIQLVQMESLSFPYADMGSIMNGIVAHAQDPGYSKADLNINAAATTTGVSLDRTYQHSDHRNVLEALTEFTELGLCDIGIEYTTGSNERLFRVYAPEAGSVRSDIGFEMDAKHGIRSVSLIEEDGEKVVTACITQGDGSGPDREEGWAIDTSGTNGVVMEELFQPAAGTHHDLLSGIAAERVERLHNIPIVPQITVSPDMLFRFNIGDTIPVLIYPQFTTELLLNANYRVMASELDTHTDELSLTLNAV